MVSVPLLTERMGVNYFEENLLELYLQVMAPPGYFCASVHLYSVPYMKLLYFFFII